MPKAVERLIWLCRYAYAAAVALGIPGWTYRFFRDVLAGMPLSEAMAISLFGLAATIWLGIGFTHAIDWYLQHSKATEEGDRVADLLQDIRLGGVAELDAHGIVNIWFADQPTNAHVRLATKTGMYARLREAVRRGWIRCHNFPAHEVRQNFVLDLDDAIEFFRRHRWLEIN